MDIGKALGYYTKDPKFGSVLVTFSLLILSCIFILPILFVLPVMTGYFLYVTHRIQKGDYTLPEINYSDMWKKGAVFVLAAFVLGLALGLIQTVILRALGSQKVSTSSTYIGIRGSTELTPVGTLLALLFNLITSVISAALYVVYAKTMSFDSLLNVENYQSLFNKNGVNLVLAPIVLYVITLVVMILGFLALCIGILPAVVITMFIQAGLYGQLDVSEVK